MFGDVTGLKTNFLMSTVVPICCGGLDISDIIADLPARKTHFPIKYLGLPLTMGWLRRVDFQTLVDKTAAKLNRWNGRNLNYAGRLTLVKSALTSQAIYFLSALRAPKAILKDIDAKLKRFLWVGTDELTGSKCKVNWVRAVRSKKNGGLGTLPLVRFARALRLKWLWRAWSPEDKPWIGTELPCNNIDLLLFADDGTTMTIGKGKKIGLWNCAWVQGRSPRDIAPSIFKISRRKDIMLDEALTNNTWISDIVLQHPSFSANHFVEFIQLWTVVQQVQLRQDVHDEITWKFTESKQYSASSTYHAQFLGAIATNFNELIWSAWVPPRCKLIIQLACNPKQDLDGG